MRSNSACRDHTPKPRDSRRTNYHLLMDRQSEDLDNYVSDLITPVDKRIRVFYLSYHPPVPTWGTAMSFYRHFVGRDDFEIFVATDSAEVHQYEVPYRFLRFDAPKWLKRMQH